MGIGTAKGEGGARAAAEAAIKSPLGSLLLKGHVVYSLILLAVKIYHCSMLLKHLILLLKLLMLKLISFLVLLLMKSWS